MRSLGVDPLERGARRRGSGSSWSREAFRLETNLEEGAELGGGRVEEGLEHDRLVAKKASSSSSPGRRDPCTGTQRPGEIGWDRDGLR